MAEAGDTAGPTVATSDVRMEDESMTYNRPGPRIEGRVVNVENPEAVTEPVDLETAFAQYDDLCRKNPEGRFRVERRTVFVEAWERAGGEGWVYG